MTELINLLIPLMILVESGGDNNAIGDGGKSVGCLQITPAVIQDVNKIYGMAFTLDDRLNRGKSIAICRMYLMYYGRQYWLENQVAPDMEVLARIWNGGQYGYRKLATKNYWNKIKELSK